MGNRVLPGGLGIPVYSVDSPSNKFWYRFKLDVAILRGLEPYVLVKFVSQTNDYERLLLYGASLVRWISRVSEYRCILPLCFIYKTGATDLLYMYELNGRVWTASSLCFFTFNNLCFPRSTMSNIHTASTLFSPDWSSLSPCSISRTGSPSKVFMTL